MTKMTAIASFFCFNGE